MSKSQSALEYMMTYGWAILIIVIVAGVLYSLGIFNPSAAAITTVTGFSGFSVSAVCDANAAVGLFILNGLGYTINITSINVTTNGVTSIYKLPSLLASSNSETVYIANGCPYSSGSRYSSSIALTYTEPGRTFSGPYFSSGTIQGKASSSVTPSAFALPALVANFTNGSSSAHAASSKSLKTIWNAGTAYTLVTWMKMKIIGDTNAYIVQETPGCTSGTTALAENSTDYKIDEIEWYKFADNCTSGTGSQNPTLNVAPYNQWIMVTGIFKYNNPGGWITVCMNANCLNNTWTNSAPANYSNPNPFTNWIGISELGGKLANIQMYNYSFSPSMVSLLYSEGVGGTPISSQGLVAWWPLNGNGNDYSGNGNTLTLTNINFLSP